MQDLLLEASESDTLVVSSPDMCERLDKLLATHYPGFSRTYFQDLIEDGLVLLNGALVRKREIPELGDEIEVCFRLPPEISLEPENIPLDVLFEDDYLLAVNKPAGMVVHPAPGHSRGTFVNALLAHCKDLLPGENPLRPGIVHRLDKDTSGILLAAKTTRTHQNLVESFASRSIKKEYLAICAGRPPNMTISAPIGRHPTRRKEMAVVSANGKEAASDIQTLAFDQNISLVLIRPQTGRTHQIRVHLQHIGHPVLGDAIYGNERMNRSLCVSRQLLHAYRLHFIHPVTRTPMTLTAPIPSDIRYWMLRLAADHMRDFDV